MQGPQTERQIYSATISHCLDSRQYCNIYYKCQNFRVISSCILSITTKLSSTVAGLDR